MAKKPVFNEAALAVIDAKAGTMIKAAKDSISMFAKFKGGKGRYYAQLGLITGKPNSKNPGVLDIVFYHTCLARIPDSQSATAVPDQTHAGQPMRIWASTGKTKNQSEAEAWERLMQTIQSYDIRTSQFGMRDGVYNPTLVKQDMAAALDYLNELLPPVILEVNDAGFINMREVIKPEVVKQFARPTMEITDDMIGSPPEVSDDGGSATTETPADEESLRKSAMEFDKAGLLGLLKDSMAAGAITITADPDTFSYEQLIEVMVADGMGKPLPDFCSGTASVGSATTDTSSGAGGAGLQATTEDDADADADEEMPAADEDEELPVNGQSVPDRLMQLQLVLATEDRAKLKARLRLMGGLKPEDKFSAAQSDEDLRQWAVDLFTGKKAPVIAVVPSEVTI